MLLEAKGNKLITMLQDLKLDRWCNRPAFESVIKTLTSVRKAMDHCEDQS